MRMMQEVTSTRQDSSTYSRHPSPTVYLILVYSDLISYLRLLTFRYCTSAYISISLPELTLIYGVNKSNRSIVIYKNIYIITYVLR